MSENDGPGRIPPHNIEAEQSTLGGMLLSKDAIADVIEVMRADDFYRPAHQMIYDAIITLFGRGEPADTTTVNDELMKRGQLTRVGGGAYLHTLSSVVPSASSAGYYAKIVVALSQMRRLTEAGTRIADYGFNGPVEDVEDLIDRAQAELFAIGERRDGSDIMPASALVPPALDEIDAISRRGGQLVGVPTGFKDLDDLTQGLHPSAMIVVAGRPSLGKSTLGMDFIRSAAIKHGLVAAMFSLEMSRNDLIQRLISAVGRVPLHGIRAGVLSDSDWDRVTQAAALIAEAPLWLDDSPHLNMMEIRAKCRRLKQRHGLDLVVIDYLQLMKSPGKSDSRRTEVDEISRSIKLLAKELQIPIVAVSQLNRGPEQRADRRPQIADMKDSGQIEQDADMVILVHREDAYERESPRMGEAELIVAKHRNGPTATITVAFQGHYSRFHDMAK